MSDLGEQARAKAKRGRQLAHKLAQLELLRKSLDHIRMDVWGGLTDVAEQELLIAFNALFNAHREVERALYEEGHR